MCCQVFISLISVQRGGIVGYISFGVGWHISSGQFTVREYNTFGAVMKIMDYEVYPTFSEAYEKAKQHAKARSNHFDGVRLISEDRCKEMLKGAWGMSATQKSEIGASESIGSFEPEQGREDFNLFDGHSFWAEIRNDYFCNDILDEEGSLLAYITIDAWKTSDENEQGEVIACVMLTEHGDIVVDYRDKRALHDTTAQELIQDATESLKKYYLDYENKKISDVDKSYGYKNEKNFKNYPNEVCYIPENWDFDDGPGITGREM